MEEQQTTSKLTTDNKTPKTRKYKKMVSYSKYGYLFLIPFFVVFVIFQLIPLIQTFYYSFFEYYNQQLTTVGPNFIGFDNFANLLVGTPEAPTMFWKYLGNTMIIWIIGFIPQIIVSLLLAIWFTDSRLKIKCSQFFKAITYMPNLVMASAFGMMFLMMFGQNGPINQILISLGILDSAYVFTNSAWWVRIIIAGINWLMWFGNTTILLMSGIMGIDESIFESARLDGASASRTFWQITMPLLMPIFVYVLITSLIGGLQLFDAAQIFTESTGGPDASSYTIIMYLFSLVTNSHDYGMAGAVSVIIFIFTGVLSLVVFKTLVPNYKAAKAEAKSYRKRQRWLKDINNDSSSLTKGLEADGGTR